MLQCGVVPGWRFRGGWSLSVAAFWRVLRTLGGKNIGKCRLRAHQHPLSPPLSSQRHTYYLRHTSDLPPARLIYKRVPKVACCVHRFLISSPDLRIDARFFPFTLSCVHRFLISSPDLRIDVRFCLFMPCCVHRFLISGLDLGIDARFSPFTPSCVHRFLISSPDLRIDVSISPKTTFCVQ